MPGMCLTPSISGEFYWYKRCKADILVRWGRSTEIFRTRGCVSIF